MSRKFNGTSDFLQSASTVNLSAFSQITISFWLYMNLFDGADHMALETSTNWFGVPGAFAFDCDASTGGAGQVQYIAYGSNAVDGAQAGWSTLPPSGVWNHYALLIDGTKAGNNAALFPAAYINGIKQVLNFTPASNANSSSLGNLTAYFMSRAGTNRFVPGSLAQVALFPGALLNSDEVLRLANGVSPLLIRPSSALYFWPIQGMQTPEANRTVVGQTNKLTVTGTAYDRDPPLQYSPGPALGFLPCYSRIFVAPPPPTVDPGSLYAPAGMWDLYGQAPFRGEKDRIFAKKRWMKDYELR